MVVTDRNLFLETVKFMRVRERAQLQNVASLHRTTETIKVEQIIDLSKLPENTLTRTGLAINLGNATTVWNVDDHLCRFQAFFEHSVTFPNVTEILVNMNDPNQNQNAAYFPQQYNSEYWDHITIASL